jgi:hypothetical protein
MSSLSTWREENFKKEFHEARSNHMRRLDELDAEYAKLKIFSSLSLKQRLSVNSIIEFSMTNFLMYSRVEQVLNISRLLLERIDLKEFIAREQAELKIAPKTKQKKILQKLKLASSLFKSGQRPENFILMHSRFFLQIFARWSSSMVDVLLHQISMISIVVLSTVTIVS